LRFGNLFNLRNYFRIWRRHTAGTPANFSHFSILLNPNPYLAWSLVMGPLLLRGWREDPANGVALVVGFYVTLISTTGGIILLFVAIRRLGPKVNRILIGVSAIALAGFGLYQIWLGASALWL
jgi:hypothetical protein